MARTDCGLWIWVLLDFLGSQPPEKIDSHSDAESAIAEVCGSVCMLRLASLQQDVAMTFGAVFPTLGVSNASTARPALDLSLKIIRPHLANDIQLYSALMAGFRRVGPLP